MASLKSTQFKQEPGFVAARSFVLALLLAVLLFGCSQQSQPAQVPGEASLRGAPTAQGSAPAAPSPVQPANTPLAPPAPSPTPEPASPTLADPPTAVPTASPSPVAPPTSTPVPVLRQLTGGGCCTQPFWSPDSRQVLFIDQPAEDAALGIWGVDVTQPDVPPELVTERIAVYTPDLAFAIEPGRTTTTIERLADGQRWTVATGGNPVSVSPGGVRVAWQVANQDIPVERRTTQVWVANLDGSDARQVATLSRGSVGGWISDDVLLLSGRDSLQSREQILTAFSLSTGASTELVRAEQLRGTVLSPDGGWLAYYLALNDDPAQNGLYLVRTDGSAQRKLDRALFGAFRWRDANRLLVIPFRPEAGAHELWEVDARTGQASRVTDPAITPFKVANGDWTVSPDGRYVAFVESRDHNLWLLPLPN